MSALLVALSVLASLTILAGAWLGWQLLRQNSRILLRLDELEKRLDQLEFGEGNKPAGLVLGSEAPAFELPDLDGEGKSLAQYRGRSLLLIFFNPACSFCRELVPKLAAILHEHSQPSSLNSPALPVIISTGGVELNRTLFGEYNLTCPVLLQKQSEIAAAYDANGTPSGYHIDSAGRIASELAMGGGAVLKLWDGKVETSQPDRREEQAADTEPHQAEAHQGRHDAVVGNGNDRTNRFSHHSFARSKIRRDGLKAGIQAPDFRLPRLDGRGDLALSELRGCRLLLVFSSPTCGPCLALAPKLEQFHRAHPEFQVLMVSKGESKKNRAKVKEHGLTFPIVLQQQWEISRKYAMFATPVAYLINEAGMILRDVAVGTDAILALMIRAQDLFHDAPAVAVPA